MRAGQARLRRDVAERAVAQIPIQDVASNADDEEVGKPVVVEVGRRGAHHVAVALHSGALGHVLETAVAQIVI